MKRSTLLVSVASVAMAASLFGTTATADAAAPSGLHTHTPTHVTAYNNGRALVRPAATTSGRRVLSSLRITVYQHGHRKASGSSVRLYPGTYSQVTSGHYRNYTYVTQRRWHEVLHEGDVVSASCVVTSFVDDGTGTGYGDASASCTNGYYPGQKQADEEYGTYTVGQRYTTDLYFDDQYVNTPYSVTVRSYGPTHSFTSKRHRLTVRKGGWRHVYSGTGNRQTTNFHPTKSTWKLAYSYSCSDEANFIVVVHTADGGWFDLAANELNAGGGGHTYEHGRGGYYLEIDTEGCHWHVTVSD